MTDFPHFDLPFRWVNGHLAVVEQDTVDDITNQVAAVVRCPLGFRDEFPDFGWPQPEFEQVPLSTIEREQRINDLVPGAHAILSESGNSVDETTRNIEIHLNPES